MYGELRVRVKGEPDPILLATSVPTPDVYRTALLHHSPGLGHEWATEKSHGLATHFCSEIYDNLGSEQKTQADLPDGSIVRFSGEVVDRSRRAGRGKSRRTRG